MKDTTFSDFQSQKISTSKNGISMYAITFKLGSRKISQTKHFTEAQLEAYSKSPRVEQVQSGGRTLQKSSFKIGA